ncbi:MAG: PEPxxWA-CTERM sorting domain-containing protein [Opitutales bacterium]
MKRTAFLRVGLLFGLMATRLFAHSGPPTPTNIWTGLGPTGWQDGLTPAFDGSDVLYLGNTVNTTVPIPSEASVLGFILDTNQDYLLAPVKGPGTLGLNGGLLAVPNYTGTLTFDPNLTLALSGSPSFDSGYSTFYLPGQITGDVASLLLTSSVGGGTFIFNGATGNSYTGNTMIYSPNYGMTQVTTWNSSPFGAGDVTVVNSASFIAHNTLNLTNALTLTTDGSTSVATLILKSWDAPLTFSGAVTLASDTELQTRRTPGHVAGFNNTGVYPTPDPGAFNPIIFSGGLGEAADSSHSLTVSGPAPIVLTGPSTYTGGTVVGSEARNFGSLIFGSFSAIPAAGALTVNTGGYVGIDAPALNSDYPFAAFLAKITSGNGAVGVDSLSGAPVTLTDTIDLTTGNFSGDIRLGTASNAVTLTGTIIPNGQNYQFGNGGGNLTVASSLVDRYESPSSVLIDSHNGPPLRLFLTGNNTYSGGTGAMNSFIIFDGPSALPGLGPLWAGGQAFQTGGSYIGYTELVWGGELSPNGFLSRFDPGATWGIIGFDSHDPKSPVNITNSIDLTGFNDGVFLGTSTAATLSGTLIPSTVGNEFNAANTLRFTAARGGVLTLASTLADNGAPLGVVYGSPSQDGSYSTGTIVISGANSYTGGTTVNSNGALTLEAGTSAAFGDVSGPINLAPGNGGLIGLQAGADGLMIPNNIVFQPASMEINSPATLAFTGTHDFVLSGAISGEGAINLIRDLTAPPLQVTLLGGNQGFTGSVVIQNSTLVVGSNFAAGHGMVNFADPNATLEFTTAYSEIVNAADMGDTTPVLYGIAGKAGKIIVPDGLSLTIDTTNTSGAQFGGTITGPGGNPTSASLTVTADPNAETGTRILYLTGVNTYTGGTTISGQGALGLGNAASAGTGTIHLQATNGGLAINQGVVLTNALDFQSGALAGAGTFAPTSVNGVSGGTLVFGRNRLVYPGIPGGNFQPGQLTLASNVALACGGQYIWTLLDASRTDGFSSLLIQGNLDITAEDGGFGFILQSVDATGGSGLPTGFDPSLTYSWTILTTTGSITGFDPTRFYIDASGFDGGALPGDMFTLSLDASSQNILLSYSTVPEPSTWALLILGLGAIGLAAYRRRCTGG